MLESYRGVLGVVADEHPVLGLALVHHQNLRGQPMVFEDKPFLIEPYADCPKLESWCIRKAVQTGWSEFCIQFALERAGWQGRIVAYVMPTYTVRDRFVQTRIDPLLINVAAYRAKAPGAGLQSAAQLVKKAAGNMRLKRFGAGSLMFLGSNTEVDFVEFSADVLVIDEYDKCDASNIALARDRLRASPYQQILRLGNPTLPSVGISRLFNESDGRKWFHRCDHCGFRQPLDWFLNVVQRDNDGAWMPRDTARWKALAAMPADAPAPPGQDLRPVCLHCHKAFDRRALDAMWVAERPGRQVRGYTCSRMDLLSESLLGLYREWTAAQSSAEGLATFFCSVLGIPYEFQGAKLTSQDLEAVLTAPPLDWAGGEAYEKQTVVAGIDVGAVLHVTIDVITGHNADEQPYRQGRFVGVAKTFDEVADMLRRYRVSTAVVDIGPELHKVQELRDMFIDQGGCTVWLCRFAQAPRAGVQKYGMKLDYQAQIVLVDRTSVFDVAFEDILSGRRSFPEDSFGVLGWSEQMRAPTRMLDESRSKIVWEKTSAADHFRCADVYARIACDLLQMGGTYSAV